VADTSRGGVFCAALPPIHQAGIRINTALAPAPPPAAAAAAAAAQREQYRTV